MSAASLPATEQSLALFRVFDKLGHKVLHMRDKCRQYNDPVLVDLAVMQPINQRRSKDAMFYSPKFERLLTLCGGRFRSIPHNRHATLVVEIAIEGMGDRIDLSRRHALEEFLDQQTGWLGLGHRDGGSSGSGSLEAFCIVVDFAIAKTALRAALLNSPFSDFTKIYRMPR